MRGKSKQLVAIAALAFGVAGSSCALACSVVPGYRVPRGLKLIEQAQGIILARVEDGGSSTTIPGLRKVRLARISTIKGTDMPDIVEFTEAVLSNGSTRAVPSDPRNLVDANPEAFSGSCNRVVFNEGMILVAFIRREDGGWVPDMLPFARTLEDVSSPDALWVKTVKMYATIAALPKAKRRKEMEWQREELGVALEDPDSRLMALELDRALHERH